MNVTQRVAHIKTIPAAKAIDDYQAEHSDPSVRSGPDFSGPIFVLVCVSFPLIAAIVGLLNFLASA